MGIASSSLGNVGLENYQDEKLVSLNHGLYDERFARVALRAVLRIISIPILSEPLSSCDSNHILPNAF